MRSHSRMIFMADSQRAAKTAADAGPPVSLHVNPTEPPFCVCDTLRRVASCRGAGASRIRRVGRLAVSCSRERVKLRVPGHLLV